MREHELIIDALSRRAAEELGELLGEHLWHQYETSGKISIGFRSCKGRDKS
jgi:DNA-binding GntR family transcriptional regulator